MPAINESTASGNPHVTKILSEAFSRLKKQNELTSIRSIAQQVGLSSSYLSKVFRGERVFPVKRAGLLATTLRLDHHEVSNIHRHLLEEMELRSLSKQTGFKAFDPEKESNFEKFATFGKADFWLLENWYHFAIHTLVTTDHFQNSPEWIARRLGITTAQAKATVDRMVLEKYFEYDEGGKLKRTDLRVRFPTERSHRVMRDFHLSMIAKAQAELKRESAAESFHERLISGVTFAGDPALLADAKVIVEKAMYKAAELLASGNCTEVFQLNLQLFKLTT